MKRVAASALMLLAGLSCYGQSVDTGPTDWKAELFGGYSSVGIRPGPDSDRVSMNGWAASFTSYQFFRRWGLAAEFGGNTKGGAETQSFLFGGTYRALQKKRFALTGRILAGSTRWEPATSGPTQFPKQTAFTFGFGQSVDVRLSERVALRVQPDLRFVRRDDARGAAKVSLMLPISAGLVFQFGRR